MFTTSKTDQQKSTAIAEIARMAEKARDHEIKTFGFARAMKTRESFLKYNDPFILDGNRETQFLACSGFLTNNYTIRRPAYEIYRRTNSYFAGYALAGCDGTATGPNGSSAEDMIENLSHQIENMPRQATNGSQLINPLRIGLMFSTGGLAALCAEGRKNNSFDALILVGVPINLHNRAFGHVLSLVENIDSYLQRHNRVKYISEWFRNLPFNDSESDLAQIESSFIKVASKETGQNRKLSPYSYKEMRKIPDYLKTTMAAPLAFQALRKEAFNHLKEGRIRIPIFSAQGSDDIVVGYKDCDLIKALVQKSKKFNSDKSQSILDISKTYNQCPHSLWFGERSSVREFYDDLFKWVETLQKNLRHNIDEQNQIDLSKASFNI